jgi:hypothetical protein
LAPLVAAFVAALSFMLCRQLRYAEREYSQQQRKDEWFPHRNPPGYVSHRARSSPVFIGKKGGFL